MAEETYKETNSYTHKNNERHLLTVEIKDCHNNPLKMLMYFFLSY